MKQLAALALVLLAGCRGAPRPTSADAELVRLVDSLTPSVERVVGLPFKRKPRARMISREQARAYIAQSLDREFGGGRGLRLATSYRLLGLLYDSVDLAQVTEAVLGEQVAGYYDPDSSAFFGVEGATPEVLRLTVSHELVHALQHDYLPLDSIVKDLSDADRAGAAHSVLEGQATLAMFRMTPEIGDQVLDQAFWDQIRQSAATQMRTMPQLASAPRILQEAMVFPYFSGAEYMRWWVMHHRGGVLPYGDSMPRSTEEIIAPERALKGDVPLAVHLCSKDTAIYSDVLGAAEMRVLLAEARGQAQLVDAAILGWGGDRFELYSTPIGDALVWIAVFDTPPARDAFLAALVRGWPHPRKGYRTIAEALDVSGRPGLRLMVAPNDWRRWSALPTATAAPAP